MSKPRILLLGDSIRMSYQPLVTELMAPRAEVVGPADNCRFALYTMERLGEWLQVHGNKPDVIHWNNGLWDCGICPYRGPRQFPISDYVTNLESVLKYLRTTGARIIWATITPPHPTRPTVDGQWIWRIGDVERYNAAALELMRKEGLEINDLYAVVNAYPDANLAEDKLHLSEQGVKRCAQAVVSAVDGVLAATPATASA